MSERVWIGIDLGTSGCRAIAIDDQEHILHEVRQSTLAEGDSAEQNPQQQWLLVEHVLTELLSQLSGYLIEAIAVDATSGSVMLVDAQGKPLSPMLMYNDSRAAGEAETIHDIAPAESGAHGATSGLAKLLYLKNTLIPQQTFKLMHQADWINFKLGSPIGITDYNNALKTGYDPIQQCWPDWLNQLNITTTLPKVVAPGSFIGKLKQSLVDKWHLSNVPDLIAGTTDSIAAFLATGARNIGEAVTSLGSTLVVKLVTERPIFNSQRGIYSHRLGEVWLTGGASNSGGAVLKHFFTTEQLDSLSLQIDLTATAPDLYPLLTPGERFPVCDPLLQPKLTPRPENDVEFLHGLLLGIARIEALGYQLLQNSGASTLQSIRTVGGGANNTVWQTIRQNQIAVPFIKPIHIEAAYGSALLAKNRLKSI